MLNQDVQSDDASTPIKVVIVGAGASGLMVADVLSQAVYAENNANKERFKKNIDISVFEKLPSPARKIMMAGKSGLNISFDESVENMSQQYQPYAFMMPMIQTFNSEHVKQLLDSLNIPYFVGSSGKIFPTMMKASPFIRAWLQRLTQHQVNVLYRQEWLGLQQTDTQRQTTQFVQTNTKEVVTVQYDYLILALGGASWARLGTDGRWREDFTKKQLATAQFLPANCALPIKWSRFFKGEGQALKHIQVMFPHQPETAKIGDAVLTQRGIESGVIYPFSSQIVQQINQTGQGELWIDILPEKSEQELLSSLTKHKKQPLQKRWQMIGLTTHTTTGLATGKAELVREVLTKEIWQDNEALVKAIKPLKIKFSMLAELDTAISTTGGILTTALTDNLALQHYPNIYCIGEMVDWDAPTGGYLLTGCLAMGHHVGEHLKRCMIKDSLDLPPMPINS